MVWKELTPLVAACDGMWVYFNTTSHSPHTLIRARLGTWSRLRFRGGMRAIVSLPASWVNNLCPFKPNLSQNSSRMYRLGKPCLLSRGWPYWVACCVCRPPGPRSTIRWTFIRPGGGTIRAAECDEVWDFEGGLARVRIGERIGYIGLEGSYVWFPEN